VSVRILQLTPHDPLIARDGRPFGAGQGNRMRGMPWPLPSVVAGSFRTALVKANPAWDFTWQKFKQDDLLKIAVAGVFPVHNRELYLPAPNDCVWDETTDKVHRVQPIELGKDEGVDFPIDGLWPVRLTQNQAEVDFKAKPTPPWWPLSKLADWLTSGEIEYRPDWFRNHFLNAAVQSMRDHVCLDADRGAAAEGQIFATAGLNVTHLPRFYVKGSEEEKKAKSFIERFAEVSLSARISIPDSETALKLDQQFDIWHPLGGERRLVHWHHNGDQNLWTCPAAVRKALAGAPRIRMVLATPALFKQGWKPDWLNDQLEGCPPRTNVKLKLIGVSNGRWKAVSGWSLAPPRGPKPIRRMVPAGSVYFFTTTDDTTPLADQWLQPISDDDQERRDGFGIAVWGTW